MNKNEYKSNKGYYEIGMDDLKYLTDTLASKAYNNLCFNVQQVCEKMIKSVLELEDPTAKKLLNTHDIKHINRRLESLDKLHFDDAIITEINDIYYEVRYPGAEYLSMNEKMTVKYMQMMYDIVSSVNTYRLSKGLPIVSYTEKYFETDCNSLENVLNVYFIKYNIKSVTEKINELKRLKELSGTDDSDELTKFIKENFL